MEGHHQVQAGSRRQQQRQEALPSFVAGGDGSRAARPRRPPRVVRAAVDEDLYKVPSDMLRKKKGVQTISCSPLYCIIYLLFSCFNTSLLV